jgi:hypothetical protein
MTAEERSKSKTPGRMPAVQGRGQKRIPRRPRGGLCRDDSRRAKQKQDAGRMSAVQGRGQKQILRRPNCGLCQDDSKRTKQKQDARQDESGTRARTKADPSSGEKPSVRMTARERSKSKTPGRMPAVQGQGQKRIPRRPRGGLCRDDSRRAQARERRWQDERGTRGAAGPRNNVKGLPPFAKFAKDGAPGYERGAA